MAARPYKYEETVARKAELERLLLGKVLVDYRGLRFQVQEIKHDLGNHRSPENRFWASGRVIERVEHPDFRGNASTLGAYASKVFEFDETPQAEES